MTAPRTIKPAPPSVDAARRALARHGQFSHLDLVRRGAHLLIVEAASPDEPIARIKATSRDRYTADFRNHRGRWESLPIEGDLESTVAAIVEMLGPYLEPTNAAAKDQVDTSGTDH